MSKKRNIKDIPLDRRQFIGRVACGAATAAGLSGLTYLAYSEKPVYHPPEKIYTLPDYRIEPGVRPKMVIAHGKDVYQMVKAAIDRMGGIEKFIRPGEVVAIKPNVAWDRLPEQAANTNPAVVAAVAKLCVEARAGKVLVTDVSLNDPYRCFARSGIEKAAIDVGAEIWIPHADDYFATDMKGSLLTIWPVAEIYHKVDRVINVPVVKHHSLSKATLAQKNWYGVLGGRRNQLHQDIHTSIADLSQAMRPTLTVMDATRALMRNGPTGGSLDDVLVFDTIIAGLDEVAIDAYSMGILGVDPASVGYMTMAEERGLGTTKWKESQFDEIKV